MWADPPRSKPMHHALHQELGIPINQRIPIQTLRSIIQTPINAPMRIGYGRTILVTTKTKYRANFALNAGQGQSGGI